MLLLKTCRNLHVSAISASMIQTSYNKNNTDARENASSLRPASVMTYYSVIISGARFAEGHKQTAQNLKLTIKSQSPKEAGQSRIIYGHYARTATGEKAQNIIFRSED